jgi:hypothetical protein
VKRSLSTGSSRGEARDYSRPSLLALPRGIASATAAHSAHSPDADGAATPAQMVEVRRLFNETGLDVRVSATLERPRHWSCGQVRKAARSS